MPQPAKGSGNPMKKSLNPSGVPESPLNMGRDGLMSENAGDVYQLACLELRGGNRAAVYQAELPGLNVWVSCCPLQPAVQGGDLYYLSVCSQGSISRVTIADVAGHGESVSSVAENLRDALREHADHWDQSALIRRLNDGFLKGSLEGQYATAFLLSHYAATGELLFTNAGHLPPLWFRAASRKWTFMWDATPYSKEIADLPLGMIPGTAYTQTAVQLEPDDLVLLYTDGVNESCDGQGEQLGLDRLLEMAETLPIGSAQAAGEALVSAVAGFRGPVPPADDETVVALHCHAHLAVPLS
jgi:sigma-B regulation protein RsbU (phosphoserine phosphatase)